MSREPREQAIAGKLAARYPADRWALVPQVRSAQGGRAEGLRVADLIAAAFWPSDNGRIELIEIKASAGDLRRETPEKSAPFVPYACACWIAVPAPWHRVVPSKSLVPVRWGLLSVGTGAPEVIVLAAEREPTERLSAFELALHRAAVANTGEQGATGDAPMVDVIRPHLVRGRVGLGCHHAAMVLAKTIPARLHDQARVGDRVAGAPAARRFFSAQPGGRPRDRRRGRPLDGAARERGRLRQQEQRRLREQGQRKGKP